MERTFIERLYPTTLILEFSSSKFTRRLHIHRREYISTSPRVCEITTRTGRENKGVEEEGGGGHSNNNGGHGTKDRSTIFRLSYRVIAIVYASGRY
jgi:hypothetical protein